MSDIKLSVSGKFFQFIKGPSRANIILSPILQTVRAFSQTVQVRISTKSIQLIRANPISKTLIIEDEMPFARRTDHVDEGEDAGVITNVFYRGRAMPGTLNEDQGWEIIKRTVVETVATGEADITDEFANGQAQFSEIWNDRLVLTYT